MAAVAAAASSSPEWVELAVDCEDDDVGL